VTLLGAGSNLLVSDRGLAGLVIGTRHLRYTQFNPDTGEAVARWEPHQTGMAGLSGGWRLEWAGIPGSVMALLS